MGIVIGTFDFVEHDAFCLRKSLLQSLLRFAVEQGIFSTPYDLNIGRNRRKALGIINFQKILDQVFPHIVRHLLQVFQIGSLKILIRIRAVAPRLNKAFREFLGRIVCINAIERFIVGTVHKPIQRGIFLVDRSARANQGD